MRAIGREGRDEGPRALCGSVRRLTATWAMPTAPPTGRFTGLTATGTNRSSVTIRQKGSKVCAGSRGEPIARRGVAKLVCPIRA